MNFIKVFTGPMRCGKSEMLIEEYNRSSIAKRNTMLFKPLIDTRTPNLIVSRNGKEVNAIEVKSIKEIYDIVSKKLEEEKLDCIFIDEFQFFNDDVKPILDLADKDIKIFISGLNLTSDRLPFGSMNNLLCIASDVVNLVAVCENCYRSDALYTFCKNVKNEDVLVGDEQYIPVCDKCWNELNKNNK